MNREDEIMSFIRSNPYISQQELAEKVGISRPAVANYITRLIKKGLITGRAYVIQDEQPIVCIGGMNLDRKMHSKEELQLHTSNPVVSSKSMGGVARNISENIAKLSVPVSLISTVGQDSDGDWLLEETSLTGVNVAHTFRFVDQTTGTYTAILDYDGEMVISYADMDIYDSLTPKHIDDKWGIISNSKAIVCDTNINEECLSYIIERSKEEERCLIIDPVSVIKARKLPTDMTGVYAILPNQDEAAEMAQMSVESNEDIVKAAAVIRSRGVKNVIITIGKNGVYYDGEEGACFLPSITTNVKDVTGAGDSFVAGVLYGMHHHQSIKKSCLYGMLMAHMTLQTDKTVSTSISKNTLETLLEEHYDETIYDI